MPPPPRLLPPLGVGDFGPGLDHVIDVHQAGKVIGLLHKDDPVRPILPNLRFPAEDPYAYVFVHGGRETTRFENLDAGTHEIPDSVVAALLGGSLTAGRGSQVRMCTCFGNLLRPGDALTLVGRLALLLPWAGFEGYHGLVRVRANPAEVRLGLSVQWDPTAIPPGPVVSGPPGDWEPV